MHPAGLGAEGARENNKTLPVMTSSSATSGRIKKRFREKQGPPNTLSLHTHTPYALGLGWKIIKEVAKRCGAAAAAAAFDALVNSARVEK